MKPFPFRLEFPPELPISGRAEEITAAIAAHQVVILAGETGSGKTTQIPKMCLAAGRGTNGRIACTQPRRVAALSVSRRVAEELGVAWGREVGCKIRFNDQTTRDTVIKFLTDGMLLAEVQGDPLLRDYDTIIIDEAHERSLNIDFLLGHLRTLRYQRPDLKIVITSATIDTEMFSHAFDGAPIVQVEGRTFPVEVIYAPLDELGSDAAEGDEREARAEALHYIDGAVEAVERIVRDSERGDILVFLPSERDIRELSDLLEGRRLRDCELVPLFGRLSNSEQQRVFAATQRRKIVLATNIAETSLTIPGIRFVVDTGLARLSRYSPQARTRRLPIEAVSQSSADQRKGRSGRVAEGVCIRLYSEKDFLERPRFTQPEIQRANLADVILRLKAFGLGDIERFPFINMPAAKSIRAGYALLEELGAIESGRASVLQTPLGDTPATASARQTPYDWELTPLGRELARLPVDPTVGRMILQARTEKALREVLVIAAGLSIQDPRERPLDQQQQADVAHRRFAHPDSDFLTLLNVWDAWHDQLENLSQAKLRRFCRDHFLSYTRMREWRDIHAQLFDTLREREDFKLSSAFDGWRTVAGGTVGGALRPDSKASRHPSGPKAPPTASGELVFGSPGYRAIHRSILSGLLGNLAHLDEENGGYKATHDRKVTLFPGSVLFRREEPKKRSSAAAPRDAQKKGTKSPRWIIAAEIMETSRLFARTCARLDPLWALDLGAHLVRVAHSEPFWDVEKGRVMAKQRTRLYGLELESKAVGYGKIDPPHATEIFIREGLVNDTIAFPLDFIAHNRTVREKVEHLLTRTRDAGYLNLDEAAYRFYAARLMPEGGARSPSGPELQRENVSSTQAGSENRPHFGLSTVAELVDLVRERRGAEPRFLMMEPDDLRGVDDEMHDAAAFPAALPLDNRALPLAYAYKPGQADDGVTLDVSVRAAEALTPAALDWAVPGHLEAKVEHYVRALPKELRRVFVPLAETAKSLAAQLAARDRLTGRRESLTESLAAQITERFRVAVDPAVWVDKPLPDHLRVRVRVLDDKARELCASRELEEIDAALHAQKRTASASVARIEPEAWRRARAKWETAEQTTWTFGDMPERVLVTEQAGVPVFAFPGLLAARDGVALRLGKTPEEAQVTTRVGLAALLERQLSNDLGWLERDLRAIRLLGPLLATLAPADELQAQAFQAIRRWLTDAQRIEVGRVSPNAPVTPEPPDQPRRMRENPPYLRAAAFAAALEKSKADLRGLVPRFCDQLREILTLRQALLVQPNQPAGLDADLTALLPPDFLRTTPYAQLAHFPRYLKAMKFRAERWRQNPAKDAERTAQLAPYVAAVAKLRDRDSTLRWLVEEFRVSLFAQELGTAEPVSAVKLDRALAGLQSGAAPPRAAAETAVKPKPIVSTQVAAKKSTPLKNLGALDKLFPK
ncbi:MAG: ATP-dependent RNA helicase HrpA [Opitutus sp.]|nr:ATP-dependent RNA helicase HrpA [Opitutus sp.]